MKSIVAIFFLLPFAFSIAQEGFTILKSFEVVLEDYEWMEGVKSGGEQWNCYFTYNGVVTKIDCGGTGRTDAPDSHIICNCNLTVTNPASAVLKFNLDQKGSDLNGSCEFDLFRYDTPDGTTQYQQMFLRSRGTNKEDIGYFAFRVKSALIDCASRPKDSANCSSPDDTIGCYAQPGGAGCKTSCPVGYRKEVGICVRESCINRTRDSTAASVCGEECYGHTDGTSCVESCPTSHYKIESNKECKWKDCLSRIVDDGARNPCGEGTCYKQPSGDQCNTSCPDKYVVGAKGTCTLGACQTRLIDENSKFPCGDRRCYKQPYNLGCAKDCPALHYEPGEEGVCVLKPCRSRQVDQDAKYTCGDPNCTELPSGKCW